MAKKYGGPKVQAAVNRKARAKFPSIGKVKLPSTSLRSMRAPRVKKPSY